MRRLLLVVAGVLLLDASRNGPFTQYNLLTVEIQGFAENDKVHGGDHLLISLSVLELFKKLILFPQKASVGPYSESVISCPQRNCFKTHFKIIFPLRYSSSKSTFPSYTRGC